MRTSEAYKKALVERKQAPVVPIKLPPDQAENDAKELEKKFKKAMKFFEKFEIERKGIARFLGIHDGSLSNKISGIRPWRKEEKEGVLAFLNAIKEGALKAQS